MDGPEKLLRAAREDVNRFPPWIRLYIVIILIVIIEVKPQHIFRTRNLPKFLTPSSEIRGGGGGGGGASSRHSGLISTQELRLCVCSHKYRLLINVCLFPSWWAGKTLRALRGSSTCLGRRLSGVRGGVNQRVSSSQLLNPKPATPNLQYLVGIVLVT